MSMSAVRRCIKKAGKALSKADQEAVFAAYEDAVDRGIENPAQAAVDEVLEDIKFEREMMIEQIAVQGGRLPASISFAKTPYREIAEKISSMSLLDGDEMLDIPDAKITKAGKLKATAKQLAIALVARAKKHNRGKALGSMTPRSKEILAEAIALETEAAIKRTGHAGNWYSTVLQNAVNIAALIHPELKTDVNARNMFTLGLAIASNGNDVDKNTEVAEAQYAHYKKHGKFKEENVSNQGGKEHFKTINGLLDRWGIDMFVKVLNTPFTVGELKQLGFDVAGENMDFLTHGSAIFGPKVGAGFFQNLMGNFDPITMDRWFMRTWGRLAGTLMPDLLATPPTKQIDAFVEAIRANPELVKALGFGPRIVLRTEQSLIDFAAAVHRHYAKTANMWWGEIANSKGRRIKGAKREVFDSQAARDAWVDEQKAAGKRVVKGQNSYAEKNALNLAGKNLDQAINAPIIAPVSAVQRNWIRSVTALALEKMTQRGIPVNSASLQALIWYPEKDLYLKYGVGNAKSAPTDYEQEFEKLALKRGISQRRIDAARTGDSSERGSDGVAAAGSEQSSDESADAPILSPKGKRRLLQLEAFRALREQLPRSYRRTVPKGREKQLDGAPVLQLLKPVIKARNVLKKLDMAQLEFMEITGSAGAGVFHGAIRAAADANPDGAAVWVYTPEEYTNMRLYLTPDKTVGFAIKEDGDLVSLFKHPDQKGNNVSQASLMAGVAEGGTKLDAFDTILPMMYSVQGFRVVSRLSWNENEAPPGWDKEHFKDWNDGEPDVVFMVYDRNHKHAYTGANEGQMVETPAAAVEIQEEAVEALVERNNNVPNIMFALPKKTQDKINSNPKSPLARLGKLGATLEQQANLPPTNPTKRWWAKVREDGSQRGVLGVVPRRYLMDYLPEQMVPSLKKIIAMYNKMDGLRNELQMEYEGVARKWMFHTMRNKEESAMLSEVMMASTLAEVDPAKKYVSLKKPENMTVTDKRIDMIRRENYAQLKSVYDGLSDRAKEIYTEVRDSYSTMRKRSEASLNKRIKASEGDEKVKKLLLDTLRKKFEAGRVRGVYFPLMRYGDMWAAVKDEDGEVLSFSRFETRDEMNAWKKEWNDAGYTDIVQGKRSKASDANMLQQVDPKFAAKVAELVGKTGNADLMDDVWQLYLQSLPEMSVRKQYMHRKGRLGFAADGLRAYANVSFRNAHQQSKLEYGHQLAKGIGNLEEEIKVLENDPKYEREFNWATPLLDEIKERHALTMNPKASKWALYATSGGFIWFLGMTPAAAAVNLSQTALVGLPTLAAEFNSVGAFKELGRAAFEWAWNRGKYEASLRGAEREALVNFKKEGGIDRTQAHDLASLTELGSEGAYNKGWSLFMEVATKMFHMAETMNREVTFMASYRLAKDRGDSHGDAQDVAGRLTWDSHFDYSSGNRPPIMQGDVGRVVLLFKQYPLNMLYRMGRDLRDGFLKNPNVSQAEKTKAKKRFAGMMGMAYLLAGYTGLPTLATAPVNMIISALLGDEDEPVDAETELRLYLTEVVGAEAAQWIMNGAVDGALGATVSSRVSLGQLLMRDTGEARSGRDWATKKLIEAGGPIVGTVFEAMITGYDIAHGEADGSYLQIGEKLVPKVLRDQGRAFRYATEGAMTKHVPPSEIVPREDFTAFDIFWTSFGFTPTKMTDAYDVLGAKKQVYNKIERERRNTLGNIASATFAQDKKELARAYARLAEFNRKYPRHIIVGDDIASSVKTRGMRDAMQVGGVDLPRRYWYLHDSITFNPDELSFGQEEKEDD